MGGSKDVGEAGPTQAKFPAQDFDLPVDSALELRSPRGRKIPWDFSGREDPISGSLGFGVGIDPDELCDLKQVPSPLESSSFLSVKWATQSALAHKSCCWDLKRSCG